MSAQQPQLTESKRNQLIRTAKQAYECIVEHLKRDTDRIAPKKGVLKWMLEESLGDEVCRKYNKDLNAGHLNHKNISDSALSNDFHFI